MAILWSVFPPGQVDRAASPLVLWTLLKVRGEVKLALEFYLLTLDGIF